MSSSALRYMQQKAVPPSKEVGPMFPMSCGETSCQLRDVVPASSLHSNHSGAESTGGSHFGPGLAIPSSPDPNSRLCQATPLKGLPHPVQPMTRPRYGSNPASKVNRSSSTSTFGRVPQHVDSRRVVVPPTYAGLEMFDGMDIYRRNSAPLCQTVSSIGVQTVLRPSAPVSNQHLNASGIKYLHDTSKPVPSLSRTTSVERNQGNLRTAGISPVFTKISTFLNGFGLRPTFNVSHAER
eukprot:Filipodium_phascolosomae@DN1416_c0_g1_i1.p1